MKTKNFVRLATTAYASVLAVNVVVLVGFEQKGSASVFCESPVSGSVLYKNLQNPYPEVEGRWLSEEPGNNWQMYVIWNGFLKRYQGYLIQNGALSAAAGFQIRELVWEGVPIVEGGIEAGLISCQKWRSEDGKRFWKGGVVDLTQTSPYTLVTTDVYFTRIGQPGDPIREFLNRVSDAVTEEGFRQKATYDRSRPAEDINEELRPKGYDEPPYRPNTQVDEYQTKEDTVFLRFYNTDGNVVGRWMMRADQADGLTMQQIREYFSIPGQGELKAERVNVPAGTKIRVGQVNPLPEFKGIDAHEIQYELGQELPRTSFEPIEWNFAR